MRLSSITRLAPLTSGAIIGFVLSLVISPSKANAGCGDYVLRGQTSATNALTMPQENHHQPGIPKDHKVPCSGPHCSRGSQAPWSPVPTVSSTTDHWALTPFSLPLQELE